MHPVQTSTTHSPAAISGAVWIRVRRLDNRNRNNNVSLPQADD